MENEMNIENQSRNENVNRNEIEMTIAGGLINQIDGVFFNVNSIHNNGWTESHVRREERNENK